MRPALPFDVFSEDGLDVDDNLSLFVNLEAAPVVFSVRGIAYFGPRFKYVGIKLSDISTPAQFTAAHARWLDVELELLRARLAPGSDGRAGIEQLALGAVLDGDLDEFERLVQKLEHRKRANLRLVS